MVKALLTWFLVDRSHPSITVLSPPSPIRRRSKSPLPSQRIFANPSESPLENRKSYFWGSGGGGLHKRLVAAVAARTVLCGSPQTPNEWNCFPETFAEKNSSELIWVLACGPMLATSSKKVAQVCCRVHSHRHSCFIARFLCLSNKSVGKGFVQMFLLCARTAGVSAYQLAEHLNIYFTNWYIQLTYGPQREFFNFQQNIRCTRLGSFIVINFHNWVYVCVCIIHELHKVSRRHAF